MNSNSSAVSSLIGTTLKPNQSKAFAADVTVDDAWDAVVKRDRHYDGRFVYAAVTTGIYCRPSCPARNPQRQNMLIFWSSTEAERQGYVPCLRCYPNSLTEAEKGIKAVLDYIETHLNRSITLNTLAQISGLSPHHLREIFKRIVGVSPKAFCDARRTARFKQCMRAGHSISSACYEAGFGSSRALYERASKVMGMTPAVYKSGARGVRIWYAISGSLLGLILTARTELGLCAVLVGEEEDSLVRELRDEFPNAELKRGAPFKPNAAVDSCQAEDPLLLNFPIGLRGRIFEAKVWDLLT